MKRVTFTYDSKDMKHGINGEIGEACASILLEDDRAKEIRSIQREPQSRSRLHHARAGNRILLELRASARAWVYRGQHQERTG